MTANDIISPENLVYKKPELMNDTPMHYCPGCSHGHHRSGSDCAADDTPS